MIRSSAMKSLALTSLLALVPTSAMAFEFNNQACDALNVFAQEKLQIVTHGPLVVISYEDTGTNLIYPDVIKSIEDVGMINEGEKLKGFTLHAQVNPTTGGRVIQLPENPGVLDVTLAKPTLTVNVVNASGASESRSETIAWANVVIDQKTTLTASGHTEVVLVGRLEMYRSGHHYFANFSRNFHCEAN